MIELSPIAIVRNAHQVIRDDHWGEITSTIELLAPLTAKAFEGIETFSHIEVIFFFNQVDDEKIETGSRHPRNNPDWPIVGILAQRSKNRPNRIGATICRLLKHEGNSITVQGLDAIDGTPVLDIKPVMREFLPSDEIRQPEWVSQLMQNYWK